MTTGNGSTSGLVPEVDHHHIDRVCLRFEDACQSDTAPKIEDYLVGWRGLERSMLLRELLLLDLHYLRQKGIEPSSDEFLARFPSDQEVVADVFGICRPPQTLEHSPGSKVGRYVIERKLGNGSFGTVYQAWDSELERMIALKVPHAERFTDETEVDLFTEEARTAAKLNHPAIVPVLDVFPGDSGAPIIVMPYIEGCSLRESMLANQISLTDSIELLIQIASAMDYAHGRGLVHRDLEPRNILLDTTGQPHITDFGLAVHESTQEAKAGESAGSLAYMSPEQLRGESNWLDGRSDIWAIGVIMYELLTGRRPFNGRSFDELASEIFAREPKPPRQINADVPVELEQICLTCLEKHVANRYATAQDLANALRTARANLKPNNSPVHATNFGKAESIQLPERWRFAPRAWSIAGIVVAGLTIVASTVAGWFIRTEPIPTVQDISVAVWTSEDEFRGTVNRTSQSGSPVRTGDKIRLTVELDRAGYLYVVWIGTDGELTLVHPWSAGKVDAISEPSAVSRLDLPAALNSSWQVRPGDVGAETVIAIVARKPLQWSGDFAKTSLRPQTGNYREPLWFESGRLVPNLRIGRTRSPDVSRPTPVGDPVLSNQLEISQQIQSTDYKMYALSIPFDG